MKEVSIKTMLPEITDAEISYANMRSEIAAAIIKKRHELCMDQKSFAEYVGVSQGMVSRWEKMQCNFSLKTISEICEKLGLEVDLRTYKKGTVRSKEIKTTVLIAYSPSSKAMPIYSTGKVV